MIARKYLLAYGRPTGAVTLADFKLVEEILPELQDEEILVRADFISVDPIVRIALSDTNFSTDEVIPGPQVATVIASKCAEFPKGIQILGKFGWRDLTIYKPEPNGPRGWRTIAKLPDMKGLPVTYALGSVGMPGNAAYFGVTDLLKPIAGETLVVTSASGAVGSLVGQIGKIKGCTVIGLTGSDNKMEWLKTELGFDHVLNYKNILSVKDTLKTIAPQGIDCYFDTVGGEVAYDVMECMNNLGRVAQCGSISSYNDPTASPCLSIGAMNLRGKNLSIYGFNTGRWNSRWMEGVEQIRDWIVEEKIKVRESVKVGFLNTPQAFLDLLAGNNVGKQLIKV